MAAGDKPGDRAPADGTAETLASEAHAPTTADDSPNAAVRKAGPRPVRAGDTLGRYELVEDVGEGGMATVYRARDRELRRDVALKVLFPHLARRPEIVKRFQREARAAAGLEHENILRIYDVGGGEADDPPYIVMELVRGSTLLGAIERGPLLAEIVACIGALLADALAVAHAAGIVHRDIKPANVLVAPVGRILLADFGVARLETEDSSLATKTGALLGTPAYMSPEQAGGETATAKSDLYSLGATLYQLATGALPYAGSPAKVMSLIATGALVPPIRKHSAVGPDLSRAIEQLMATEPAARPANAKQVAQELRALAAAGGLADPGPELAQYFADPDAYLRVRTPGVVSALVASARTALADARLPRAMALADRASALAPDDATVTALISMVTEGGRASRRRRVLAIGAALAVVAGGGALAFAMLGGRAAPPLVADAGVARDAPLDIAVDAAPDAASAIALDAPVAMIAMIAIDAPRRSAADAGLAIDAPIVALAADAAVVAEDAAPISLDAATTDAWIIVVNDVWCDIRIDSVVRGRQRDKPLHVQAGHHTVSCMQSSTGKQWSKEVDVVAGQTLTVRGEMIGSAVEVHVATSKAVIINGSHYKPGAVTQLAPGRYEVTVPDVAKKFLTIRQACTIRETPELDCYP